MLLGLASLKDKGQEIHFNVVPEMKQQLTAFQGHLDFYHVFFEQHSAIAEAHCYLLGTDALWSQQLTLLTGLLCASLSAENLTHMGHCDIKWGDKYQWKFQFRKKEAEAQRGK